ncbi:MAG: class II aldolase/adducin family protein [Steroidobacteraceae bacterium]
MSTSTHSHSTMKRMSPPEWALRVELAAAYRLVAFYGWDDLVFTHLSVRVPGPEHHFLINPFNLLFEEITASSLVKIGLDGLPVEHTAYATNPAGFTIHSAIHQSRADAIAVMHLHTDAGQAVSAMQFGLLPDTQMAMIAGHDLAYHDYEGIATDLEERGRIVADLGDSNSMLLRNHGTLAVGECIADCFLRIYFLERACAAQVLMLAAGRNQLVEPTSDVRQKVGRQLSGDMANMVSRHIAWPALLRKLDRLDQSYKH